MPEREVNRFGEKLRALRSQRGLTVRALAKVLGVSHSTIVEIETSSRKPSIDLAYTVATYFEVSADDLLDDEREV
jgi:transcriptional regulator with XRE-family HTH domain